MRGLAVAATFGMFLITSTVFAQAVPPAGQAPAAPRPAAQAPAVAPSPAPPVPFIQGAKVGFVNLQAVAGLSVDGKAANAKAVALAQKKQNEGQDKAKALQANQQKLATSGSVMSEVARTQLEKEIERQQVDGQRFEQDAQAEINELQQQLQADFQGKLVPILEALAKEKGLQVLFSYTDAGAIWVDPGVDLTMEAVKRLDTKAAPAAK